MSITSECKSKTHRALSVVGFGTDICEDDQATLLSARFAALVLGGSLLPGDSIFAAGLSNGTSSG